jgi:hypothetical protein
MVRSCHRDWPEGPAIRKIDPCESCLSIASADGVVQSAFGAQGGAEAAVGVGVILLDSDGFAVFGDGLVQLALVIQSDAEAFVGVRVIVLETDGFSVFGDGLF